MKKFKKSRLIVMIIVLILTASALLLSTYSTWLALDLVKVAELSKSCASCSLR